MYLGREELENKQKSWNGGYTIRFPRGSAAHLHTQHRSKSVCRELINPVLPAAGCMAEEDPFVFQSTLIFAQRSNRKQSATARERSFDGLLMHGTLTNLPGCGLCRHVQPFVKSYFIDLALKRKIIFSFFAYLSNDIARPVQEPLQQKLDVHLYDPSSYWRSHGYSLEH